MKNTEQGVQVLAAWLPDEPLIGTLYSGATRGNEVHSFEFADSWLSAHPQLTLDPDIFTGRGRQYTPAGKKIFGMFSDAAPDRWGRRLLERKEEISAREEGRPRRTLHEADYLLGVDDFSRMGALRFRREGGGDFLAPSDGLPVPPLEKLRALEQAADALERKDDPAQKKWLLTLLRPGASLGGARPKATVMKADGTLWIAKFPSRDDKGDAGAWERTANRLAEMCSLDVPQNELGRFLSKKATFLCRRFDRAYCDGRTSRVHYASAMTMLGEKDGAGAESGASYLDLAGFIKSHGARVDRDLAELWRRIVFNMLVSNTDDHLRNHGFLLEERGWTLAPLFDVNPNPDGGDLTLNVTEHDNTRRLSLALETAGFYGLAPQQARAEIDRMARVVSGGWRAVAARNGISRSETESMAGAFALADDWLSGA